MGVCMPVVHEDSVVEKENHSSDWLSPVHLENGH